jgi:hypothetical protein
MIRFDDLPDDKPMNLRTAARYIGSITGETPHISTLWRWCLKGSGGVKLDSICVGGKRFVTRTAIRRFVENSTAKRTPSPTTVVTVTPHAPPHVVRHNEKRRAEIAAARRQLDELTGAGRRRGDGPKDVSQSA